MHYRKNGGRFRFHSIPFGWYPVLYSDELDMGEVVRLPYFERDMVAWRDDSGDAHVFDAICPHYGAHMGYGGRIEDGCLRCPFHGIKYRGDGQRAEVPFSQRANKRGKAWVFETKEQNEQLLVWFHPEGHPPSFDIPVFGELLDDGYTPLRYRYEFAEIPTAWHMIAEQVVDFNHFLPLHGVDLPAAGKVMSTETEFHVRVLDTPELVLDSSYYGPGVAVVRYSGSVRAVLCATTLPINPELLSFRISVAVEKQSTPEDTDTLGEGILESFLQALRQDMDIMSHQVFLDHPALVPEDGDFMTFRRWTAGFHADEGATIEQQAIR